MIGLIRLVGVLLLGAFGLPLAVSTSAYSAADEHGDTHIPL